MLYHAPANMLPRIMVSETEEHLLTLLATAELMRRPQDAARTLLAEMERADVVSDEYAGRRHTHEFTRRI